jgi:hypothetical protein
MEIPSYFIDFLKEIRLTDNQVSELKKGHELLRKRLNDYEPLSPIIVSTFLQGSYRRSTAVRPKGDARSDVDVIVVTKLSQDEYTPRAALDVFVPFLEKYYAGKYRIQGRSIGISLSYVDLDIVPTSAPSESEIGILESSSVRTDETIEDAEDWVLKKSWLALDQRSFSKMAALNETIRAEAEWKLSPLYIPDCEVERWTPTHPLEQLQKTRDKNKECNKHFVNVVKALKWWRRLNPEPKHPKSYPLEHFIWTCCPDGINSVAEGVTKTLETIVNDYSEKPVLPDHGVPEHNVFARVTDEEYDDFYQLVCDAAKIARKALDADDVADSANAWRELFGSKFPAPPDNGNGKNCAAIGGFTPRKENTVLGGNRFA